MTSSVEESWESAWGLSEEKRVIYGHTVHCHHCQWIGTTTTRTTSSAPATIIAPTDTDARKLFNLPVVQNHIRAWQASKTNQNKRLSTSKPHFQATLTFITRVDCVLHCPQQCLQVWASP